jgi:hypothetical protein
MDGRGAKFMDILELGMDIYSVGSSGLSIRTVRTVVPRTYSRYTATAGLGYKAARTTKSAIADGTLVLRHQKEVFRGLANKDFMNLSPNLAKQWQLASWPAPSTKRGRYLWGPFGIALWEEVELEVDPDGLIREYFKESVKSFIKHAGEETDRDFRYRLAAEGLRAWQTNVAYWWALGGATQN